MTIQLACSTDITSIVSLIQMRIEWMDKEGINQWNKSDYLKTFTLAYFDDVIQQKQLYVAKTMDGELVGAFTLFEEDSRWADGVTALYIHNFVSQINFSGVGGSIIAFCEKEAKGRNINRLRIDCQKDNEKLNRYYEQRGFKYVSSFAEELYNGNRREKIINDE